jgi:nicotinamidase-related amidase
MAEALVVIDVLIGIFELPVPLHAPEELLERTTELLERARSAGALIVHVQQIGPEGSRFAPGTRIGQFRDEVKPLAGEVIIQKGHPDAFQGTTLDETLRGRGIRGIVITGFASEFCVDATVRSGYARGFAVELAADAHTTTAGPVLSAADAVAHHNFVLARFARVLPAAEIRFAASAHGQ